MWSEPTRELCVGSVSQILKRKSLGWMSLIQITSQVRLFIGLENRLRVGRVTTKLRTVQYVLEIKRTMILSDFPLYDYQEKVVRGIMRKRKQHGLFLEVGAGKTICCLAYAETHPKIKKVLILCRKDNIKTWRDEVKKWTKSKAMPVMGDTQARLRRIEKFLERDSYTYLVANYDAFRHVTRRDVDDKKYKMENALYDLLVVYAEDFDYVVLDESVELKNARTDRHKDCYEIIKQIPRRAILDGCPNPVNVLDLWGQFKCLDDGRTFGDNFFRFRNKHFVCINSDYNEWQLKQGHLKIIQRKMAKSSIHIKKRDVRDDLPEKIWNQVHPTMVGKQAILYRQMRKWFMVADKDLDLNYNIKHSIVQLQKMHQISNGFIYDKNKKIIEFPCCKDKSFKDMYINELRETPQVVCWAAHIPSVNRMDRILKKLGRKPVVYHGQLTDRQKDSARDGFLSKYYSDFLGQSRSGVGINELSNADHTIFWSNDASLRARVQCEGRIDRDSEVEKLFNTYTDIIASPLEQHITDNLVVKQWSSDNVLSFRTLVDLNNVL